MPPAVAKQGVIADITYTVDSGEKLINETFGPGNIDRLNSGTYERRPMRKLHCRCRR